MALDQVGTIVEGRMHQHPGCPKCQAQRVVRNGQADGLQRYKCRSCGVTFNALTGTPLARLRHRGKWVEQAKAMDEGLSVRKAAARMEVHRTTAFRWRHRFLAVAREAKAHDLSGVAEADETYVLRSYKGQRRKLQAEQVPILVLRNRAGETADHVLECANKRCVIEALRPSLASDAVLCTDGCGMLAKVASELGIEHHAVNTLKGEHARAGLAHPRTSTRITAASSSGCADSTAWPRPTCRTTSAGSERWTGSHNHATSPCHFWLWLSAPETVLS